VQNPHPIHHWNAASPPCEERPQVVAGRTRHAHHSQSSRLENSVRRAAGIPEHPPRSVRDGSDRAHQPAGVGPHEARRPGARPAGAARGPVRRSRDSRRRGRSDYRFPAGSLRRERRPSVGGRERWGRLTSGRMNTLRMLPRLLGSIAAVLPRSAATRARGRRCTRTTSPDEPEGGSRESLGTMDAASVGARAPVRPPPDAALPAARRAGASRSPTVPEPSWASIGGGNRATSTPRRRRGPADEWIHSHDVW
jgi:hypothetical protein